MQMIRSVVLGAAVLGMLSLSGCGGASPPAQKQSFHLQISGHTMTPDKLTAHQGDTLTLTLTADKKEEIHLHGYDYRFQMTPGQQQVKTFTADKTGTFEIEIEDTSTHLGELDVYPR